MVDADTILYVGLGIAAVSGAGLMMATRLIDRMNPKVYLEQDEIENLSELENELQKEKEYLDGFGSMKESLRYRRVTSTLENLASSDYRRQGWIRTTDLEDVERAYHTLKFGIKDD